MAHLVGCCVCVCCVLCFLLPPKQSSVLECHHISYFEKWKLWALFFGGCLCWSNYDQKKLRPEKRYSRLAVGWNKSQITIFRAKIWTPTITGKNFDRKKKYSCLAVSLNKSQITICRVKIWTPTMTVKNYVREKKVQSFATHATFYFYYVCP